MNLDLFPIGWVHFVASLLAIAFAAVILSRAKGTPVHKRRGRFYVAVVLVTGVTALMIYRRGIFFFPHWFAIASLATTAVGFAAARFKIPANGWVHVHLTCMLASVYILIGGGVNEVFLRVDFLRRLVPSINSPIVGSTHLAVLVLFAGLIVYFNVKVSRRETGGDNAVAADEPRPAAGGDIPKQYTCDGRDISPPLAWTGAPPKTASYALVVEDEDAPGGVFRHWVAYNIAVSTTSLPAGYRAGAPAPFAQGRNDFGKTGYGGPCPPLGSAPHRYVFTLMALSQPSLTLAASPDAETVITAAIPYMVGRADLTLTYQR